MRSLRLYKDLQLMYRESDFVYIDFDFLYMKFDSEAGKPKFSYRDFLRLYSQRALDFSPKG